MKVDGSTGIYDGVIRIITENKAKTIYLTAQGTDEDEFITLDDCLKLIGYNGEGTCMVIFDDLTHGEIYMYGNYSEKCWTDYGTTRGFA